MNTLLKQLQNLYDQELHSNLVHVCDLMLTVADQKPEVYSAPIKFQITLYYADALYHTLQYSLAEHFYRQTLQIRKQVTVKNKNLTVVADSQIDMSSDVEIRIKYQIYLCSVALKEKKAAVDILQSISARLRTPKINMALGNLYKEMGMDRSAIYCFKEVLRDCPLALDAVESLLKMGIKGVEVNSFTLELTSEISWLNTWLKAQAQLHSRDYINAIQTYKSLDVHGLLKDNALILVNMAYSYHYLCEDDKTITLLQKAVAIQPKLLTGRDLLSTVLAHSGTKDHIKYLETLLPTSDSSLWKCEEWIVFGNYMFALKKYEKATYFAQQALFMNPRNIDALLLKANALMQCKAYLEAANHCSEALQWCKFRFDVHKCIIECYIQLNRLREAESLAIDACSSLNYSAHAYTLHASVLLKDSLTSTKSVRKILEKAIAQDKAGATSAASMLVKYFEQNQQFDQALKVLLKHVELHPTSLIHQLIGDCYINLQKDEDAFDHYTIAINLDPANQRAIDGLNAIGRCASVSKRDSYCSYVGGESSHVSEITCGSDHEGDAESDTDPWSNGIASF